MSPTVWWSFFAECLVISLTPGAGAVASMSSGAQAGWRAGLWTALGLQLGLIAHLVLVVAGLGALVASSPVAFAALQIGGCLYLAWVGARLCWGAGAATGGTDGAPPRRPAAQLTHGFLVNATNPKAIVFLLAVLPPFLDPSRPLAGQYFAMGLTLVAVDTVVMVGFYTWAGARLLAWLAAGPHRRWVDRGFGLVFLLAAGMLAVFRR